MSYYDLDAKFVPIVTWPGQRTERRERSRFKASPGDTLNLLKRELRHLAAKNIIVQLDCDASQIRLDGYPRAGARVRSPGLILTFDSRHGPLSYPCDRFTTWDDNLRAIALALEALRKVDRYGVTKRGEQYRGWGALPPAGGTGSTMTADAAARVVADIAYRVGGGDHAYAAAARILEDRGYADAAYRKAAKACHPDAGGDVAEFQRLQVARAVLAKHHGGAR